MKKLFSATSTLLLALLLTVSGCSSYKSIVGYVENNCKVVKTNIGSDVAVYYECTELYNTDKVKDKCSKIEICFDAASAKISGKAVCSDSLVDIKKLIQLATQKK